MAVLYLAHRGHSKIPEMKITRLKILPKDLMTKQTEDIPLLINTVLPDQYWMDRFNKT
ncbi:MAG: hypothetical protein ACTSRK_21100 [Promethearchaeota archaeon]